MDSFRTDLRAAHYQAVMRYAVGSGLIFSLNLCFSQILLIVMRESTSWSEFFVYVLFVPFTAIDLYRTGLQLTLALRQCWLRRALRALDGSIPVRQVNADLEDYGTITVCFLDGTPERFDVPPNKLDAIIDRLRNSYRFESHRTSVTRPWWILQHEV